MSRKLTITSESEVAPAPPVADPGITASGSLKNPEHDGDRGHGLDYHGQRPPNELKPDAPLVEPVEPTAPREATKAEERAANRSLAAHERQREEAQDDYR